MFLCRSNLKRESKRAIIGDCDVLDKIRDEEMRATNHSLGPAQCEMAENNNNNERNTPKTYRIVSRGESAPKNVLDGYATNRHPPPFPIPSFRNNNRYKLKSAGFTVLVNIPVSGNRYPDSSSLFAIGIARGSCPWNVPPRTYRSTRAVDPPTLAFPSRRHMPSTTPASRHPFDIFGAQGIFLFPWGEWKGVSFITGGYRAYSCISMGKCWTPSRERCFRVHDGGNVFPHSNRIVSGGG